MDKSKMKRFPDGRPSGYPRSMVLHGAGSMFHAGNWFPAADVYETASAIIVYMDISGIDPHTLAVTVEDSLVTVSGMRGYEPRDVVSCVHQLEIERGFFERSIPLPKSVDVAKAASESRNGFLQIILPLRRNPGKIKISVK
ncbi:MAG: Hsp20/alpha crystallin family protein [Desulfobulbaceae bacterium]|nr:Hsp20/alpha crystallin family protein [Desulfobulbaceae bacterium]HIJ91077.1 Hsp20/alpha crystallin family protein [Deltaproteobacteria bacterium]